MGSGTDSFEGQWWDEEEPVRDPVAELDAAMQRALQAGQSASSPAPMPGGRGADGEVRQLFRKPRRKSGRAGN